MELIQLFYGNSQNNHVFDWKSSQELVDKITKKYFDKNIQKYKHFYVYEDLVKIGDNNYKRHVLNHKMEPFCLTINSKLEPINYFPSGIHKTLFGGYTAVYIHPKIKIVFNKQNRVFLEIIKDEEWDIVEPIYHKTLNDLNHLANSIA